MNMTDKKCVREDTCCSLVFLDLFFDRLFSNFDHWLVKLRQIERLNTFIYFHNLYYNQLIIIRVLIL
jgi:hypothetical protein